MRLPQWHVFPLPNPMQPGVLRTSSALRVARSHVEQMMFAELQVALGWVAEKHAIAAAAYARPRRVALAQTDSEAIGTAVSSVADILTGVLGVRHLEIYDGIYEVQFTCTRSRHDHWNCTSSRRTCRAGSRWSNG